MWYLSTEAQIQLQQSHAITARAIVSSPSFGTLTVPISDGEVTADATSHVRRVATIETDPRNWPTSPTSLLAPFGSTCRIEYGIILRSGEPEWVPLGQFSLDETSRSRPLGNSASVTVKLVDYSARVSEDRFPAPTQTIESATVVSEIIRLVRDVYPGTELIDLTGSTAIAEQIVIDKERWKDGIEKLADSIAAEAFFDQVGRFVIRPQPTLDQVPAWTVKTGLGGNILSIKESLTRDRVYNQVVVSGQRTDGTDSILVTVEDNDPTSPTFYGGAFGRKARFYSSPLFSDETEATAAGLALLQRVKGLSAQVSLETIVNPALEPGDVIRVIDQKHGETRQAIDKVTTPLSAAGAQPISTRTDDLPAEQG